MANKVLWAAETSVLIASGTQINGLGNNAFVFGNVYDNSTSKNRYADFELDLVDFAAAPTAGGYVELHLVYAYDGTYYADGASGIANTSAQLGGATMQGVFPIAAVDGRQFVQINGIQLSPYKFKPALKNLCGQAIGSGIIAGQDNELTIYPYNEEIQ